MLIDLRNLLSGAKDDMTVSAPLEMETFQTALAEYPVMEKRSVELVLTRTGKDKLHISGNGFVALEIPCDRCLEPVRTEIHFDIDKDIDMQETSGEIEDELKSAGRAVGILGGELEFVDKFMLPGTDASRSLVVIKKVKGISKKYPRKAGMPTKEPLG